jgi:Protein of unknown function (DUF3306)
MSDEKQDFLRRWSRLKSESAAAGALKKTEDEPPVPLPPLDSLTFESDFKAFMQAKIEESVKRAALKKLFSDPRFNVMDGLDTYIDDYTKSDTIPPEMLARLERARQKLLEQEQNRQEVPATQDEAAAETAKSDDDPAQDPEAL